MVGVPALGRGSCVGQFLLYSICISTFLNLAANQCTLPIGTIIASTRLSPNAYLKQALMNISFSHWVRC